MQCEDSNVPIDMIAIMMIGDSNVPIVRLRVRQQALLPVKQLLGQKCLSKWIEDSKCFISQSKK